MNHDWEKDYSENVGNYSEFQQETFDFVIKLADHHKNAIHVANVNQRPYNKIKGKESIKSNHNAKKYDAYKTVFDLKDISGVRVTCHCEDDVENFAILLEGEIAQRYADVTSKEIGGKESDGEDSKYPYRAVHLTFSKSIKENEKPTKIFSEIQIRTVMADAWAVQIHKYIYKQSVEGEYNELTAAVSEIMNGCEKLWSVVKKKSQKNEAKDISSELSEIHKEAEISLNKIQKNEKQIKALENWFAVNKKEALKGLLSLEITAFMEVEVDLSLSNLNISKKTLDDSARESTIDTFGWPIGIYLDSQDEFAPKVGLDGIHAEVAITDVSMPHMERNSYDYWAMHTSGAFFLLKSLFEDLRNPEFIFFDTRIVRIAEVFMYLKNLYAHFEVPRNEKIDVSIKHGGLKGRILRSSSRSRDLSRSYGIETDEVPTNAKISINEIELDLAGVVEKFTKPLFEQFSFFELGRKVLEDIVNNYRKGKIVS